MDIYQILKEIVNNQASDLHLCVGAPPTMRKNGKLIPLNNTKITPEDTKGFVKELLNTKQYEILYQQGQVDFSLSIPGLHRFRMNAYRQRGSYSLAVRLVYSTIPDIQSLGLPPIVGELTKKSKGLILVTGPAGSGKSTTLASMINKINQERQEHIITLEQPIEYLHSHNKSIINQREVGSDTVNFAQALRSALRQDPDIILIGEMRDLETISIALTAAETGHLVLSTLHTVGAAKTIDRIIDVFPPGQQQQIRIQLSMVLQGVISQQLIPTIDNLRRIAAVETMVVTPAIRHLIREGKTYQIQNVIQTGGKYGMKTMDQALLDLYRSNIISRQHVLDYSTDMEYIQRQINV
ncbi:MAG TPA: type IV pilus twitching motility protein PilT [Clostridiales bacterium]|nr:type IV pilus twitching motility protein PilT [Clostridiales bacterium]